MSRYSAVFPVSLLVASLALGACNAVSMPGSDYYRVTDPATGRVWYTRHLHREAGGVVEFREAGTGVRVSLREAQVDEVSREDFISRDGA